ncbi:hypothetical protein [Intestinibacter sp.]|uniref:hypothetical protein n=1 Tax=Intestinibacter sp. TaxID=1965304 RepID=UPI00307EA4C6
MDFTVNNIRVDRAAAIGLNAEDIIVLSWFIQFSNSSSIERKYIKKENDMGYWINYDTLIKELPLVFNGKTEKGNKEKLRRMFKGNLSKVLMREQFSNKKDNSKGGSKIFIVLNRFVYESLLIVDTEIQPKTDNEVMIHALGIVLNNNIKVQLSKMDESLLELAIAIAKDNGKKDQFKYIKGIYNNLEKDIKKPQESANSQGPSDSKNTDLHNNTNNSIPQIDDSINNNYTKNVNNENEDPREKIIAKQKQDYEMISRKNKFHNTNASFINYTPDELERHLQESQKGKFK